MKAAIIDDLDLCRREIRSCFTRYIQENCAGETPVMEEFPCGEDFLSRFTPGAYDIIFIDQYMDGLSGLDTAREIRRRDRLVALVFVTTSRDHAVRDEGTSYHYIAPSAEIEAEAHATRILEQVLNDCGYSYVKGKTWTSDAIYRETVPGIQERRQEGCLVVEMECASMMAAAKYRQIPFIQFLYGADNLSSDTWEIRDLSQYGLNNAEKYMALAFECGLALD